MIALGEVTPHRLPTSAAAAPLMSTHDDRDALHQLRADLAALRARTTAEFGPFDPPAGEGNGTAVHDPAPDEPVAARQSATPSRSRTAPPDVRGGRARPARPPRRILPPRATRPPRRLAVPAPIPVARRPDWLAGPRWPSWDLPSGATAAVIGLLAVVQMAHRLVQAMLDTSVLLGADPTRTDHLHAAAGVAGGGVTLALALAALAVVKARTGYLVAAGAVLLAFGAFPAIAHTANAGIVAAPLPDLGTMIRPPRWGRQGLMVLAFCASLGALVAALADLAVRSLGALSTLQRR